MQRFYTPSHAPPTSSHTPTPLCHPWYHHHHCRSPHLVPISRYSNQMKLSQVSSPTVPTPALGRSCCVLLEWWRCVRTRNRRYLWCCWSCMSTSVRIYQLSRRQEWVLLDSMQRAILARRDLVCEDVRTPIDVWVLLAYLVILPRN